MILYYIDIIVLQGFNSDDVIFYFVGAKCQCEEEVAPQLGNSR